MIDCCFPEMARTVFDEAGSVEAAQAIFWLMAEIGKQTDEVNIQKLAIDLGFKKHRAWRLVRKLIEDGILIRQTVAKPLHNRDSDRCNHSQRLVVTIQYSKLFEKLNRNTNRYITVAQPLQSDPCDIAPVVPIPKPKKPVEKPVDKLDKPKPKSAAVVDAYFEAYGRVYKDMNGNPIRPARNAKLNSIACKIVDAVGEDMAVKVVAFYLTHRGSWYVQKKHELDYCLKDIQGLRTEYLGGVQVTKSMADRMDKNAEIDQVFETYKRQKISSNIGF